MSPTHELKANLRNPVRAEPVEIWKARSFIEDHSGEELSLRTVAKAVNISANHLSEKFKQVTGVNFIDTESISLRKITGIFSVKMRSRHVEFLATLRFRVAFEANSMDPR